MIDFPPLLPAAGPAAVVALVAPGRSSLAALGPAGEMLQRFGVAYTEGVLAARGTSFSKTECFAADAAGRGVRLIIVGSPDAGLPAALAAGGRLPVIRVPTPVGNRRGLAVLACLQNPPANSVPGGAFATMAIGEAGARNAALLAVAILALSDERLRDAWHAFRAGQADAVLREPPPAAAPVPARHAAG